MPDYSAIPVAVPGAGDPPAEFNSARTAIVEMGALMDGGLGGRVRPKAGQWSYADVFQLQGTDYMQATAGRGEMCPLSVAQPNFWVDGLGTATNVAAAGGVIRLGIYGVDSDGNPGPLVVDAGTVSTTTTGEKQALFTAVLLDPGQYWLIEVADNSTVTLVRTAGQSPSLGRIKPANSGGSSFDMNGSGNVMYSSGWTATSALPSTAILTSLTGRVSDMPFMTFRRAA